MKGLLEELWRRAGCMYLSDLRSCSGERLRRALVSLPVEPYSLQEWTEAVRYLTGKTKPPESKEQAVKFLLKEAAGALEEGAMGKE